ncbi:MAG TPA: exodeoxyribonuclease VII small subunit [Nitrolancea sp.]
MNQSVEDQPTFEELSQQLEAVLARLERGDLALEEALSAYEQGVTLVRQCNDLLDRAELRITELSTSVAHASNARYTSAELLFELDDEE